LGGKGEGRFKGREGGTGRVKGRERGRVGKGDWWIRGWVMGEQSRRGSVKGGSGEGWVMGSGRAGDKSG
jgi:hypothetical protein